MLIPKRICPRLKDLTPLESSDLFECVYNISPILEKYYNADALNIAMQDGKVAGQSVPHVHFHILPRKPQDFKRNDDVYEHLDSQNLDKAMTDTNTQTSQDNNQPINLNNNIKEEPFRVPRTLEDMAAEAMLLRALFPNNQPNLIQLDNLNQT